MLRVFLLGMSVLLLSQSCSFAMDEEERGLGNASRSIRQTGGVYFAIDQAGDYTRWSVTSVDISGDGPPEFPMRIPDYFSDGDSTSTSAIQVRSIIFTRGVVDNQSEKRRWIRR